ncbi:hypothetical protein HYR99_30785 [Candidatus Poribacteria bacterium]|nr:hypothetical protein [Candidatus Poribacteria bacterium]
MGQNRLAEIISMKQGSAIAQIRGDVEKEAEISLNPLKEFLAVNVRCKEIPTALQVGDVVLGELIETQTESDRRVLDIISPMRGCRANLNIVEEQGNASDELSTSTFYASDNELYSTFRHDLRGRCLRGHLAITLLRRLSKGMKAKGDLDFDRLDEGIDTASAAFDAVRSAVQGYFSVIEPPDEVRAFDVLDGLQNAVKQVSILSGTVKDFLMVIELEMPGAPVEVSGSEPRLEQAFFQLLLNSVQSMVAFIGEAGKIWVTAKRLSNNLEIVIKDTGSGIPRTDFERVFEPFYTTYQTRLGLGLSVARHIIESQFQGHIQLESVRFIGTSVFIELPL